MLWIERSCRLQSKNSDNEQPKDQVLENDLPIRCRPINIYPLKHVKITA